MVDQNEPGHEILLGVQGAGGERASTATVAMLGHGLTIPQTFVIQVGAFEVENIRDCANRGGGAGHGRRKHIRGLLPKQAKSATRTVA